MAKAADDFLLGVNRARFTGQTTGHYESYFVRANHPKRPIAFWIRYTIFAPKDRPDDTRGELWAIVFNGETGQHVRVKEEHPIGACRFSRDALDVLVGRAALTPGRAHGTASSGAHEIGWSLTFAGSQPPVLLLPERLHKGSFPAAKSLVALPMARFHGRLRVDGQTIDVEGWRGSQNHNWGRKHTDLYAWGQVAGFDNHPDNFLEVATARLKIGPLWTPPITPFVLRHRDRTIAGTGLWRAIRAKGEFGYFRWAFASKADGFRIEGEIDAPRDAFVGLTYDNPPGGSKVCLNSKIARCRLRVTDAGTGKSEELVTENRAAFELLTDDRHGHGVTVSA